MKSESSNIPKLCVPGMIMAGIAVMVLDVIAVVGCFAAEQKTEPHPLIKERFENR
jgi:hypothetical protein